MINSHSEAYQALREGDEDAVVDWLGRRIWFYLEREEWAKCDAFIDSLLWRSFRLNLLVSILVFTHASSERLCIYPALKRYVAQIADPSKTNLLVGL